MRKRLTPLLGMAMLMGACHPNPESLVGEWEAYKVNVQFDERRSTPELVKQIGAMEKRNLFRIGGDSTLVFNGLGQQWESRLKTDSEGNLYADTVPFGRWENGEIVTTTPSPLGEIVVTYRKK